MSGYVYIADKGDGTVKIGCSSKPELRLKAIENEHKFKAVNFHISKKVSDKYGLECQVHNSLSDCSLGNEFFKIQFELAVDMVDFKCDAIKNDKTSGLDSDIDVFCMVSGFYLNIKPLEIIFRCVKKFAKFDFRILNLCNKALCKLIGNENFKGNEFEDKCDVECFLNLSKDKGMFHEI